MAGQRKYPRWPGPSEKEVPYDTEHFKMWCVNWQGFSVSTANAYVSTIRTAFATLYDDEDPLFDKLRDAFHYPCRPNPVLRVRKIEDAFDQLVAHTERIQDMQLNMLMDDVTGLENIPKDIWIIAFQAYCRFIRWRTDNARRSAGLSISTPEDNPVYFMEIPMSQCFRHYLSKAGYKKSSIDPKISHLKRLYNLFLRPILKKDIFESFEIGFRRGHYIPEAVKPFFDRLAERIDREIIDRNVLELSEEDLKRGKAALEQYYFFLKDFAKNHQTYVSNTYEPTDD